MVASAHAYINNDVPRILLFVFGLMLSVGSGEGLSAEASSQSAVNEKLANAIRTEKVEDVKQSLHEGASANAKVDGDSMLCIAINHASDDDFQIVNILLDSGASPDSCNRAGCSALSLAVHHRLKGVLKVLLDRGAAVNVKTGPQPLMMAAKSNGAWAVPAILAAGAAVNAVDLDGNTAVHIAASRGDVDTLKLLIAARADLSSVNRYGHNPIWEARHAEKPEAVKLLLNNGAREESKRELNWADV